MHGFFQRTVHVIPAIYFHGWKQAGQGGAGRNGARNGHVVPAHAAKRGRLATVQVGRHQRQAVCQLAKVVGATASREQPCNLAMNFLVAE